MTQHLHVHVPALRLKISVNYKQHKTDIVSLHIQPSEKAKIMNSAQSHHSYKDYKIQRRANTDPLAY